MVRAQVELAAAARLTVRLLLVAREVASAETEYILQLVAFSLQLPSPRCRLRDAAPSLLVPGIKCRRRPSSGVAEVRW